MATIKLIKASGGDAATLHAFEALLSAANPISTPWEGVVANEIVQEAASTTFGNYGQSSTNTIVIKPNYAGSGVGTNTGCGFADVRDFTTAALAFDSGASQGAGFNDQGAGAGNYSTFEISVTGSNITIQGLQFHWFNTITNPFLNAGGNDFTFQRNIVQAARSDAITLGAGSGNFVIANNCFIFSGIGNSTYGLEFFSPTGHYYIIHNTVVSLTGSFGGGTSTGTMLGFFSISSGSSSNFFGNAIYTFDTSNGFTVESNSSTTTGDYNVRNTNTSASNASLGWTNGSASGSLSGDFVDVTLTAFTTTDCDMRAKAAGLLLAFIPSGSRWTTNNYADTDIRGQTRVGVANDCGCFQKTTAAAADTLMGQAIL